MFPLDVIEIRREIIRGTILISGDATSLQRKIKCIGFRGQIFTLDFLLPYTGMSDLLKDICVL
jgi:hypothetical protein